MVYARVDCSIVKCANAALEKSAIVSLALVVVVVAAVVAAAVAASRFSLIRVADFSRARAARRAPRPLEKSSLRRLFSRSSRADTARRRRARLSFLSDTRFPDTRDFRHCELLGDERFPRERHRRHRSRPSGRFSSRHNNRSRNFGSALNSHSARNLGDQWGNLEA